MPWTTVTLEDEPHPQSVECIWMQTLDELNDILFELTIIHPPLSIQPKHRIIPLFDLLPNKAKRFGRIPEHLVAQPLPLVSRCLCLELEVWEESLAGSIAPANQGRGEGVFVRPLPVWQPRIMESELGATFPPPLRAIQVKACLIKVDNVAKLFENDSYLPVGIPRCKAEIDQVMLPIFKPAHNV